MSDISTSYSKCVAPERLTNDNLVEFLVKLSQFGIDECLHLENSIINKQNFIQNYSTTDDKYSVCENKRIDLTRLFTDVQTLKDEFYNILLSMTSLDDKHKQLLFAKLQGYLSRFVEINLQFSSIDAAPKEIHRSHIIINTVEKPTNTFQLSKEQFNQSLSSITDSFHQSLITTSSSFVSTSSPTDLSKNWKFANIIQTRSEMTLIASDSHTVLCYNNPSNSLQFMLVTGQYQGNFKWNYDSILDVDWCSSIDRYIAITRDAIYIVQYNQLKLSSSSNPLIVNKVLDLEKYDSARITCNDNNILLYKTYQQRSSIMMFDHQFRLEKLFDNTTKQQLPINSRSFCCTNTLVGLTEQNETTISYFPYKNSKKVLFLVFDIDTLELRHSIDLNNCTNIYTMKCLKKSNTFFALSNDKALWIIKINNDETVQIATKTFYTNQTEMCVINNQDLLLINANGSHAIQLIKYRQMKQ